MSDNRPRKIGDRCYGGVCCHCGRMHADQSCCSHDACQVRSPIGIFCEKRYDHVGEHEGRGHRWTAPDPDLYVFPEAISADDPRFGDDETGPRFGGAAYEEFAETFSRFVESTGGRKKG